MMSILMEYLIVALLLLGVALMWIAAIGMLRMPDLYLRTSVSSKGATLGVASLMLAGALYFGELGASSRALAVIVFMMVTAPVAAHMIGRAAYRSQVPFAVGTAEDDDAVADIGMRYKQPQVEPLKGGESWQSN